MEKEYRISWFKVMGIIAFIVIIIALLSVVIPKKSAGAADNTLSIYINNINLMKESGFEYFQGSNLPDKVGESKSITLKELIDSKIIMEFHDENNKLCDVNNSYIKATKTIDNEYAMKVSLSCDNKSDYIVTTIQNRNFIADNSQNVGNNSNNNENNNTVDKTPVVNNRPSGGSTSGNVNQITNVNINYVDSCGTNCLNNIYYTVNFDTQGGDFVPRQIVKNGDVANYVTTKKDGYTFLGWYLNNFEYNFNTPVTRQITLVAKWKKNDNNKPVVDSKYKVYFNSNGGTDIKNQEVLKNDYVVRPNDPSKACYDFVGWYTDSNLTNYYNFNTPVTKDMTLYAKWVNNGSCTKKHIIIFNSNGGSYINNAEVIDGNKVNKPNDPSKACYDFAGWYTDSNLTNYYNFNTPVTKDMTLYAKWIDNGSCVNKYTVSFNSNGGSYVENQRVNEGSLASRPTNPVRSGYIFKGWFYNGYEFNFNTKINHDYILVASWEKEKVSYNKYCQVNKERYYSTSYVDGNKKTTYYDWVIKFDNLSNAKNVKILNNGYINSLSMYNDLYIKNSTNKGMSMVGDTGKNHVPYYSAQELRTYSLQSYNFSKYLSNAYYQNGNWYVNASVAVHNYNNVNQFYATHLNKYIYFVPFYFDVEYTNMNNCIWDKASNQYKYNNYQVMDTIYE